MDLAKELILAVKKKDLHNGYGLQKECEALISHVLSNMVKSNLPPLEADAKNEEDCIKFREEGNTAFFMKDDDGAIEKYTMSLAYAISKESMALAFANRSAALYRKKLHRECLIDINAALFHGYPEEKRNNLQDRAVKAIDALRLLYQLKDLNMNDLPSTKDAGSQLEINQDITVKGKNNFSSIKEFIKKTSKLENVEDNITNDLDELLSHCPNNKPRYLLDENNLKIAYGPNDEAPAISKGIQIAYSKKYGRHLIATKPFDAGDIIGMEKPFAYVIYRENLLRNPSTIDSSINKFYSIYYTHCHHCLKKCYNLIPCSNCPLAQYCSENCKILDWNMAHRTECSILSVLATLLNVDKDKIRILTKIVRLLIAATEHGTAIDKLRKDLQIAEKNPDYRTAGFSDNGVFDSMSARSALSLATNLDVRPLIEVSAFSCISALAVILLATQTKFFGRKYSLDRMKDIADNADIKFCATIVFRNCVIISSNSFSVQIQAGVKVGSGLFVTASLMNHSCAPNTFRHFDGLTMITRAIQPIKEGDQIFTNYCGGYLYSSRESRKRKIMEDYYFDCDCKACIEDWPTHEKILQNHIGSIAKSNKPLVAKLKPFRQRLLANQYDVEAIKSVINILNAEVKMPCEEVLHATQYLKSYYLGILN